MEDRKFRCVGIMVAGALAAFSMSASASTKISFVHSDHLGTPQMLTDEQQRIVWRADYRPYGEAEIDEDPDGDGVPTRLQLRFQGQYQDTDTGIYYNYYRDYDPTLGRYVQNDPLGLAAGPNTYAYVGGNPISYSDPYGLCPWCAGAAIGAFTGGISAYSGALATGSSWGDAAISGVVGAGFGAFAGGFGGLGTLNSALFGGLSNFAAQASILRRDDDPCNDYDVNVGSIVGSSLGSGWSTAITRSASTHSGAIAGAYSSTIVGWGPSTALGAIGSALGAR